MDLTGGRRRRGDIVARVLAGSWRNPAPTTDVTAQELARVAPLLIATGSAGLAWRTARSRADLAVPAERLHEAWLLDVGRDRLRDDHIAVLAAAASSKGVELLVYKGWAAARRYPDPGLRPSADIDIIVAPEQVAAAVEIAAMNPRIALDIHTSPPPGVGTTTDVLARADRTSAGGATLAVPNGTDELLMTSWHMLKHGAWRPLWLCDVAVLVEADVDAVAPRDEPHRSYAAAATGLAALLLDARHRSATAPPAWVVATVLTEWGHLRNRAYGPFRAALARAPVRALAELPGRFPNGVAATVALSRPLGSRPPALALLDSTIGRRVRDGVHGLGRRATRTSAARAPHSS